MENRKKESDRASKGDDEKEGEVECAKRRGQSEAEEQRNQTT